MILDFGIFYQRIRILKIFSIFRKFQLFLSANLRPKNVNIENRGLCEISFCWEAKTKLLTFKYLTWAREVILKSMNKNYRSKFQPCCRRMCMFSELYIFENYHQFLLENSFQYILFRNIFKTFWIVNNQIYQFVYPIFFPPFHTIQ